MTGAYKSVAAGNKYAFMGFLDANGYLLGSSTSAPASGAAGSGMLRITGIKSAAVTIPDNDTVQVTGDDELLADFAFDSLNTRSFNVEAAVQDLTLESLLLNKTLETVAGGTVGYLDITDAPEYDATLIFQSRSKKQDAGTLGRKAWSGTMVLLATVKPLGRAGFDERGAALWRFSVTPQLSGYNPWGVTIQESSTPFMARYRPFSFDYPITMHRHTGNGVLTTFNLDYPPVDANSLSVFSRRVAAAVSSVSTASKTMTLGSAAANGAEMVTLYQFNG